ncbi:right-handed parallel beta-helix repeat-containing protein [Verrucomicrobiota bacterium]
MNFYVSPGGNDHGSGTSPAPSADGASGPLATLAGARDAVRRHRAEQGGRDRPVTVHVAAGVYELGETLRFLPEDGGTAERPVRYVAADGAAPVISGGRRIADWYETEHNGLRCWIAELPDVAAAQWSFTRLYVNDSPRPRPRLPKTGYYHFSGLAGHPDTGMNWCKGPDRANYREGDIQRWRNWEDVELISYQLWFDTHHRFKAIDEATRTVHFHARSLGSLRDERGEFARYFVENVFEALDTPGQWYLDRPAGRLYYLPLPEETLADTVVVAPRLAELVRVQGDGTQRVAHVRFENLAFAHQHWELPLDCAGYIQAAWGVPGAIVLEGGEQCVFYGCTIAHVNGYGIEVLAGSTENTFAACAIRDAGAGGIKIGHEACRYASVQGVSVPDTEGTRPMAATVADCTIHDCGHIYPSAIGIWIGNSGWNRIVHNRIFNCNYTGISCGWTWGYASTRTVCNRIEHNHIHHINHHEILSDNGGIYTLGRQPGTVLRGNVIHDISCYGYGAWGIYPDEGSSEMRVEHNLVRGTKKAAYSTHYGRDNLVQHNVFALSQSDHLCLGKRERHRSTVFRRNVVVPENGCVRGGEWQAAHYTVSDNLFWSLDGTPFTFNGRPLADLQAEGQNSGALVADPLFTDTAGGDFSLRGDSPAKQIRFRLFDWRAAGPRLKARRPQAYAGYVERFPLPSLDIPVVCTRIEVDSPLADVERTGRAEFSVSLANIGRAAGKGTVRLMAGPKGRAGRPSVRRIAFELAPGEERNEHVALRIRRPVGVFWLETEPADDTTVPARALVFESAASQWPATPHEANIAPDRVGAALARTAARSIRHAGRLTAEIKIGAAPDGLLLSARLFEPALRPNTAQPWLGTGLELAAFLPLPKGSPSDQQPTKRRVFLVPHADGCGVDGLVLNAAGNAAERAPDIHVRSRPVDGGCEFAAVVPWSRFGADRMPAEMPFQLTVNAADPGTGGIVQVPVFDQPSDGWRRLQGKLVVCAIP